MLTNATGNITVIECEVSAVPLGDHALIPGKDLQVAIDLFRHWQHTKNVPLPETVYQTKLGFYFPLEEQL